MEQQSRVANAASHWVASPSQQIAPVCLGGGGVCLPDHKLGCEARQGSSDETNGTLTTTSSGKNMPTTSLTYVNALRMAPSGKLLAVGGIGGLQIFHFNGANPITKYTGLLTTSTIDKVYWDNSNHLYAISGSAGKLGGMQKTFPHKAMYFADATHGGVSYIEVTGSRLSFKWICADGVIRDQFTMVKKNHL